MIAATEQQMSANLTVSNRQRSVQVDLKKVEKMAERLRVAVFDQLIDDTPDHLDEEILDDMAERGVFSLVLVSDRQIRVLNNDWMGKDKPTDVLSFPLSLDPPPSPEVPWEVGEIVISLQRTEVQAREYGHSFDRELAFLFVHGMLHVLGFDHMEPADEKDMFGRQKYILNASGFKR
jgi:probable rRNA maturation factor